MRLAETIPTKHYNDRKAERGTIAGIELAKAAYGEYNIEETNQKLVSLLQAKLNEKLKEVEEKSFGISKNNNLGVCVFMPILVNGDKKYKITLNTDSGEEGNYYLAIVMDDHIVTIYPTSTSGTAEVESAINDHTKREYPDNTKGAKAMFPQSSIVVININQLYGKEVEKAGEEKTSEETLDYKVRTDYRVGATFDHKQFGPGKVVAAAGSGKAGVNGMVDWIDVKYAKPFMKGGKLQDIRRFNNILTAAYFGKTMKEASEEIKCKKCGWHWKLADGGKDPYLCHKCGHDNTPIQKEMHTMKDDNYDKHHQLRADVDEASKGLWANIRAKQERGEKPAKKGSEAYNKAVKAAKKINAINEVGPIEKFVMENQSKRPVKEERTGISPQVQAFLDECSRLITILRDDELFEKERQKHKK